MVRLHQRLSLPLQLTSDCLHSRIPSRTQRSLRERTLLSVLTAAVNVVRAGAGREAAQ